MIVGKRKNIGDSFVVIFMGPEMLYLFTLLTSAFTRPITPSMQELCFTQQSILHTDSKVLNTDRKELHAYSKVLHTDSKVIHTDRKELHTYRTAQ